jgi:hypothetical protein
MRLLKQYEAVLWIPTIFIIIIILFYFYSGMDASHPEIYLLYTAIIPAALQETMEEAGIEPELLRCSLVKPMLP